MPKITIEISYTIGEVVYLKTDTLQRERIITGIKIRPDGVIYAVSFETEESWHYNFELSKDKDIIMTIKN